MKGPGPNQNVGSQEACPRVPYEASSHIFRSQWLLSQGSFYGLAWRVEAGRLRAFGRAVSFPSWRVQPGARRTVEVKDVRRVELVQARQ